MFPSAGMAAATQGAATSMGIMPAGASLASMAFPILGGIAIGSSILGSVLGAVGQQKQLAEAERAARENARLARLAASDAYKRGAQEAGKITREGTKVIGAQKVAFATSGVDVSTGSPLAAMADTRLLSGLDAEVVKNNAAREAWGYKQQAAQYGRQAEALDNMQGVNGFLTSMLGGIGNAAGMAYGFRGAA